MIPFDIFTQFCLNIIFLCGQTDYDGNRDSREDIL